MKKRLALWLGINLTVFLIIAFVLYLKMKQGINIYCTTHQLTGLYCPGCGITRMLVSLVRGDLHTAFRYNPFLFITALPMTGMYLYGSYLWIKKSFEYRHCVIGGVCFPPGRWWRPVLH